MAGQGRFCQPGSDKGTRGAAGSNDQAVHTSPAVTRARCPCREQESLPGQCGKSCFPLDPSLAMPPCAVRAGAWLCLKWLSVAQCPSVCISHLPAWSEGPPELLPGPAAACVMLSAFCSSPRVCRRGRPRLCCPLSPSCEQGHGCSQDFGIELAFLSTPTACVGL